MWTNEIVRVMIAASSLSGDVTDAEWALLAPLIPPAKRGGASAR